MEHRDSRLEVKNEWVWCAEEKGEMTSKYLCIAHCAVECLCV